MKKCKTLHAFFTVLYLGCSIQLALGEAKNDVLKDIVLTPVHDKDKKFIGFEVTRASINKQDVGLPAFKDGDLIIGINGQAFYRKKIDENTAAKLIQSLPRIKVMVEKLYGPEKSEETDFANLFSLKNQLDKRRYCQESLQDPATVSDVDCQYGSAGVGCLGPTGCIKFCHSAATKKKEDDQKKAEQEAREKAAKEAKEREDKERAAREMREKAEQKANAEAKAAEEAKEKQDELKAARDAEARAKSEAEAEKAKAEKERLEAEKEDAEAKLKQAEEDARQAELEAEEARLAAEDANEAPEDNPDNQPEAPQKTSGDDWKPIPNNEQNNNISPEDKALMDLKELVADPVHNLEHYVIDTISIKNSFTGLETTPVEWQLQLKAIRAEKEKQKQEEKAFKDSVIHYDYTRIRQLIDYCHGETSINLDKLKQNEGK